MKLYTHQHLLRQNLDAQKLICGNPNFFDIRLHGRPWTANRLASVHDLPSKRLSEAQMGELMCAYAHENDNAGGDQIGLQTENTVRFYDAVSYTVKGKATEEEMSNIDEESIVRLKVRAGDIIEFKAEDEPDGRGFAEVAAIMNHKCSVFLVVRWILATGKKHPKFGLPQFRRLVLFENYRSGFFSISLVDELRFVNGTQFVTLPDGT